MKNLESVGQYLINKINEHNDFFSNITIIFENNKFVEWFKAYWLKHSDNVLINVYFDNINSFIKNSLIINNKYNIANKSVIRSIILKVVCEEGEAFLPSEILSYIKDENENMNSVKLYDFSTTMANLFIEYENELHNIYTNWQSKLWEKVRSELLANGYITLKQLFDKKDSIKKIPGKIFIVEFTKNIPLYTKIIDEIKKVSNIELIEISTKLEDFDENKITISSAPSKLREVEVLHSNICDILYKDKFCNYSDILVLAPNLSSYESTINRVFKQDGEMFLNIPFVINSTAKFDSSLSSGLKTLFDIINKGYYTRNDFNTLIDIDNVKLARGLLDSDVVAMKKALNNMNVYRIRKESDDFAYAKKRLLLSKLITSNTLYENKVDLSDGAYVAYKSTDLTDDVIVKFVALIDDLRELLDASYNDFDKLINMLDKWFSIKNDVSLVEENLVYKKVIDEINLFKKLCTDRIPFKCIEYALIDVTKESSVNKGVLFSNGVSFIDLDNGSELSSKYIFILGMSSNNFPKEKVKSELDERNEVIDIAKYDKITFNKLINNTSGHMYISYVNEDLVTLEEYFVSPFVQDLYKDNLKDKEIKYSIDENRPWSALYTYKEYKNKDYFIKLLKDNTTKCSSDHTLVPKELPKKVKVKEIKDYLIEPLSSKADRLFGRSDDDSKNNIEEYEPFEVSNIEKSNIKKALIKKLLLDKISIDDIENDNYIKGLIITKRLPDKEYLVSYFNKVKMEIKEDVEIIKNAHHDNLCVLRLPDTIINSNDNRWILTMNDEVCISSYGNERVYSEIRFKNIIPDAKDIVNLYVVSLMDVANQDEDVEYVIKLVYKSIISYTLTKDEAIKILGDIYKDMNDYSKNTAISISQYNKNISTIYEFISNMTFDKFWRYYKGKDIFDYEVQLGYDEESFKEVFDSMNDKLKRLIKYLPTRGEKDE